MKPNAIKKPSGQHKSSRPVALRRVRHRALAGVFAHG